MKKSKSKSVRFGKPKNSQPVLGLRDLVSRQASRQIFPAVGPGASVGGLEAWEKFISAARAGRADAEKLLEKVLPAKSFHNFLFPPAVPRKADSAAPY
jgi:hypothetical protein